MLGLNTQRPRQKFKRFLPAGPHDGGGIVSRALYILSHTGSKSVQAEPVNLIWIKARFFGGGLDQAFAGLVFPTALLYARSLVWIEPRDLIFGVALAPVQPYTGREAEAADVLADLLRLDLGAALGLTMLA